MWNILMLCGEKLYTLLLSLRSLNFGVNLCACYYTFWITQKLCCRIVVRLSLSYPCCFCFCCVFCFVFLMFWLFARKSLICLLSSLWFPLSSRNLLSFLGYCNGSYVLFSTQASLLYLSFPYCVGCSRYLYIVFFFFTAGLLVKLAFRKGQRDFE